MLKYFSLAVAVIAAPAFGQVGNPAVTTGQYNNSRTGANTSEIILNTTNVNQNQFGKLYSLAVDGMVYAQPLYVPGVIINGIPINVVYVATMHNSIYAFNADKPGSAPIWKVSLGTPASATNPNNGCPASDFTGPELGILSTPVIDAANNVIYAVGANPAALPTANTTPYLTFVSADYVHKMHAFDIRTGQERSDSPVSITPSYPGHNGTYDNQGGVEYLTEGTEVQRTSLLLANGTVYAGFGNCGLDNRTWHGWVVGYSTSNLKNMNVLFNSTPNGGEGGIWQSGRGLVSDSNGDVYLATGNATYQGTSTGTATGDQAKSDYPMSVLQLNGSGKVLAAFPPNNYAALNYNDLDFSASGPLLIPGTNSLAAGGKDGVLYLLNTGNLATPLQSFQATGTGPCSYTSNGCLEIRDLDYWNSTLYLWGTGDILKAFTFNNGQFNTTPSAQNSNVPTNPLPAAMAISANSSADGILWAVTPDNTVHAFDAAHIGTELWNSNQNAGRDSLPSYTRFVQPTVANGRVYVATSSNQVAVYGLLSSFTLSSSTLSDSVAQGGSSSFQVSVNASPTFNNAVSFQVSGLPAGAIASFNPSTITGSGTTTVTINAAQTTPTGTYNAILTATGAGTSRTASLALMVVATQSDKTPPEWTSSMNGSSNTMTFSAWDTQSGLKSIQATGVDNATVSIPTFTAGTNGVITFTATEMSWPSYVKFVLTDESGNVTVIDAASVNRIHAKPAPFALQQVKAGEGYVRLVNGTPGIMNLKIEVNSGGKTSARDIGNLKDGEPFQLNLRSLSPSNSNTNTTVTLTPLGKEVGSAWVMFATEAASSAP